MFFCVSSGLFSLCLRPCYSHASVHDVHAAPVTPAPPCRAAWCVVRKRLAVVFDMQRGVANHRPYPRCERPTSVTFSRRVLRVLGWIPMSRQGKPVQVAAFSPFFVLAGAASTWKMALAAAEFVEAPLLVLL